MVDQVFPLTSAASPNKRTYIPQTRKDSTTIHGKSDKVREKSASHAPRSIDRTRYYYLPFSLGGARSFRVKHEQRHPSRGNNITEAAVTTGATLHSQTNREHSAFEKVYNSTKHNTSNLSCNKISAISSEFCGQRKVSKVQLARAAAALIKRNGSFFAINLSALIRETRQGNERVANLLNKLATL